MAASVWIESRMREPSGASMPRPTADATPVVIERRRP